MWELYAGWTVVGAFLFQHFSARGIETARSAALAGLGSFAFIAAGGIGSVLAGAWADRLGREKVAAAAMAVSGSCVLAMGWLVGAPTGVVLTIGVIWGFAVVADSAQFSALVTEVTPQHAVGTALTLQTSLGFLLTAFSIWLTVELAERLSWGIAFSLLAPGPALGILAILRLKKARS
jgi:MFS family permease